MRLVTCLFLALMPAGGVLAGPTAPETEEQKTLYALGLAMAQQLAAAGFSEADVAMVQSGLGDGLLGREARVELEEYGPKIDSLMGERFAAATEREKQESQAYCEAKAAEDGAQKTTSGAIYFEVEAGSGESPTAADSVKVHYHGTRRDGTVFDSSVDRGEPVVFGLGQVVTCFSEGIQKMRVGGKARLVCPPDTAYGDRGSPPAIKPGAALNFDLELIEIVSGG